MTSGVPNDTATAFLERLLALSEKRPDRTRLRVPESLGFLASRRRGTLAHRREIFASALPGGPNGIDVSRIEHRCQPLIRRGSLGCVEGLDQRGQAVCQAA